MKKFFLPFISLILTALLLTSCVANQALLYEDRFDELDIRSRVNELAYHIERGETGALLCKQANTIIEDLESIHPQNDETLAKINNDFIVVARTLIQAMDHTKANNTQSFDSCYKAAKALYESADKHLNRYKRQDWSGSNEQ